jgi:SAM-dependent methyltransferase
VVDLFGEAYSDAYDSLYSDKDYHTECSAIVAALQAYSAEPVHSILDLGCGTGSHALELGRRGYEVLGIDRSGSMLGHAREKASRASGNVSFVQGDVRDLSLDREFDAAIMMFAVVGYQTENADVRAVLEGVHRHLRPQGILIFDCWYGPAVLCQGPSQRVKIVESGQERLLRAATATLDTRRGTCAVDYHVWRIRGDRLVSETRERHLMRYFFARELELFLSSAGLLPVRFAGFPENQSHPDETTWSMFAVARKE